MSKSFLEPYYDPNDSGKTPAQQAGDSLKGSGDLLSPQETALLRGVKMSGGHRVKSRRVNIKKQSGGGRTLNIPYPIPGRPDLIPGPTANNAWYVGEPCVGAHCGVPMHPTASWMINKGLTLGNEVVPDSTTMYPVVDRLGNSFAEVLPGLQDYSGTQLNPGPFQIKCVSGGRKSKRNQNRSKNSKLNNKIKLGGSPPKVCTHKSTMIACYQGLAYLECRDCHRYWRSRANDHLCDD